MNTLSQSSIIKALLLKLPSISGRWSEYCEEWGGEEAGVYNDIGVIVHHLKCLYPARESKNDPRNTSEFSAFFNQVEEFFALEQKDITELLTVGLFESLQNITASEHDQWRRFEPWLGDRSREAWSRLIQFWNSNAEQVIASNPLDA